jgi:hypothetical protein
MAKGSKGAGEEKICPPELNNLQGLIKSTTQGGFLLAFSNWLLLPFLV